MAENTPGKFVRITLDIEEVQKSALVTGAQFAAKDDIPTTDF
jgi:hypothetical protein